MADQAPTPVEHTLGSLGEASLHLHKLQLTAYPNVTSQTAGQASVDQHAAAAQLAPAGPPAGPQDIINRLNILERRQDRTDARVFNMAPRILNAQCDETQPLRPLMAQTGPNLGQLPPANVPFPATRAAVEALSHQQLDELHAFYLQDFGAGQDLAERIILFKRFIGI